MTDLEVTVGTGDVDPYLIHWSTYPRLMDRAAAPVLAVQVPPGWFRAGRHLGVVAFRCAFHGPIAFGDRLRVTATVDGAVPAPAVVEYEFRAAGTEALVADGATEYRTTTVGSGPPEEPAPPACRDGEGLRPGPEGRHAVALRRRVHLRQVDTAFLHWLSWVEWVDEGICALFAALGHPIGSMRREERLGFPLVAVEGGLAPVLVMDDEATVTTAVTRVGRASVELAHTLAAHGRRVGWARTSHVCVDADTFRAAPAPDWVR